METDINYNIVGYDSSNLKILNNIHILNGSLIMNGKYTIQDTCNYVLSTSNAISTRVSDTCNYVLSTSNTISDRVGNTCNYVLSTSNAISGRVGDTCNYVLSTSNAISARLTTTSNVISTRVGDTSNYIRDSSNVISTRISNLKTNNITEDVLASNKFIVNNVYGNNLTVNGNLMVNSNLTVGGTSTILNTDVFTTEVLEITNEGGGDVALKVTQKSAGTDIINALNGSGTVFKLTSNGDMGIGVTTPAEKLDVNGNMRLNGNLLPQFSASSNIGSLTAGWSNIYFTGSLFKGGQLFIASNWDKVANNNINFPSFSVGIGSTTPTQKLDVAGNINISTGSTYKVNGVDISLVPAGSAGKYLVHNGSAWVPADILTNTTIAGVSPIASGGTGAIGRAAAAKNILPPETTSGKYLTYDGTNWVSSDILTLTNITVGAGGSLAISRGGTGATTKAAAAKNILPTETVSGKYLTYDSTNWVSSDILTLANITGGPLSLAKGGTGAATQLLAAKAILPTATSGQYLTYNGTNWVPANILTLTNITTGGAPLTVLKGGTGATTQAAAALNILPAGTNGQFLKYNGTNWISANVTIPPSFWIETSAGTINYTGDVTVGGNIIANGEITAGFSDIRLKDEITIIENPLELISSITGFYYRHNDLAKSLGFSDDKREIGLSAQEVQKVIPEVVRKAPFDIMRDDDDNITSKSGEDYLTICYERLIPVIVESIKELNNEISKLKKDNDELRRMVSASASSSASVEP
jgi:hypothetical protein